MHIEVKLFANLRKLLPPGSSGSKAQISLEEGATIAALIHHLKIPLEMAQMVLVNGEQTREFDRPLAEGDTVSIFPPVAGGNTVLPREANTLLKNQYFGDINDYRKYGLLRCLQEATSLSLGVCWLLTEDDGRTDGEFRRYLAEPARWRHHDPALYDELCRLLLAEVSRNVAHVRDWCLLGDAIDYDNVLRDSSPERNAYFRDAWSRLERCPLVFFDPDNGIEVGTIAMGRKNSSKYLYWSEIEEAYARGHSLIVYQHFPRRSREQYVKERAGAMARRLGAPLVDSFQTPHVVFFLVARPEHAVAFESAHELIQSRWAGQIRPVAHVTV